MQRSNLHRVEERLSDLGIPFPAEHSSLRESAKIDAALQRLERAVQPAVAKPAKHATPAEPAPPPPRRGRRRARRSSPAADSGQVEALLSVLREARQRGAPRQAMGELETATGIDRDHLRPLLKQLVHDGRVTRTGRARGTRYSVPADDRPAAEG